ncbi:hypothetical protein M0812_05611 [Anaeramoeba flamelloides]|uniref:G-protein coupled receptors family 1 profile domain-containing protein n=1 Tax=Anaeramoeba flamelloides TaxID=1746091 RepID=A0AAV8A571_9EUKA|nr:hypothetical protein M0812_05611 [Anaeramoeba flamelloides]
MDVNETRIVVLSLHITIYAIVFLIAVHRLYKFIRSAESFSYMLLLYLFVSLGCFFEIILQAFHLKFPNYFDDPGIFICAALADFFIYSSFVFIIFGLVRLKLQLSSLNLGDSQKYIKKYWIICLTVISIFFFCLIGLCMTLIDPISNRTRRILGGVYDLVLSIFSLLVSIPFVIYGVKVMKHFPTNINVNLTKFIKTFYIVIIAGLCVYIVEAILTAYAFYVAVKSKMDYRLLSSAGMVVLYSFICVLEVIPVFLIIVFVMRRKISGYSPMPNEMTRTLIDSSSENNFSYMNSN